MNEDQAQNLIMDYLYAELTPEQEAEFEGHLAECGKCREEVNSLRGLMDSYRRLPAAQPPTNAANIALARARGLELKPEAEQVAVTVAADPEPEDLAPSEVQAKPESPPPLPIVPAVKV